MRFHDLRHSAATLLLGLWVHRKVVQEQLGHSTVSLTLDIYSQSVPALQADAALKLDALLSGPVGLPSGLPSDDTAALASQGRP